MMTIKMETFYLILSLILCQNFGGTSRIQLNGPELESMPAAMTHFSNTVGLMLTCVGRGPSPLTISWLSMNGEMLSQIEGIREQLQNGSLYFKFFKPEDYIPTVHNGEYRCSVRNPVGTFLSPVFSVRAIVDHPFEVMISTSSDSTDLIIEGSPTLLFCDVSPSFYTQFVSVIGWKTIDQFGHETEIKEDDSRYKKTVDGSLLIFNTKYQQLFVCIGKSTLNNNIQGSAPFLLKSRAGGGSLVPNPKFIKVRNIFAKVMEGNVIRGEVGKTTDLICLAIGSPSPNFRWEKYHKGKFVPVTSLLGSSAIEQSSLLRLTSVSPSIHNGTYRCEVSNSFGTFTSDYHFLLESTPVLLMIEPRRKVIRNGENIELSCRINTTSSIEINNSHTNINFSWYKNGKAVVEGNSAYNTQKLQIFNAKIEHQGVYQCFAEVMTSHGISKMIYASSNIIFEALAPELVQTFISQTLQPGPFISLKCSAIGNPIPTITWYLDDAVISTTISSSENHHEQRYQQFSHISIGTFQQFNSETMSYLNISRIQPGHSGVYKCEATNLVGMSYHSARLNIYGMIFVKQVAPLTLVAGSKMALIPCYYGGYPIDKISWQKDSRDIKTESGFGNGGKGTSGGESRFTVFPNGTLKIERVSRDSDIGLYVCIVSNRKGEIASGSVNVNVMHSPVISPFRFDDDLREGQRTSASCNVIKGDLPIDIVWLKDSLPIPDWLNLTETRVKFLSVLFFDELTHKHGGEYTCSVSNAAANVTQSAKLNVKVPPKWEKVPEDAKVVVGSDHFLFCSAIGEPKPTISWFLSIGGIKYAIKTTTDKFQLNVGGDGGNSMKISDVEETDASNYVCEAGNGVGPGISKSIRLSVIIPAKVSAPMTTSVVVAEGLAALLKCEIRGDPPIQVSWKKDSVIIESEESTRSVSSAAAAVNFHHRVQHQRIVDGNSSVLSAQLRINPSERSDSGLYLCLASNPYGRDEAKINLEVKARPSPPENFMVTEIGSRFIRLEWSVVAATSPDDDRDVPVTYFILQSKKSLISSWNSSQVFNLSVTNTNQLTTHAIIESLNPVTNYDVRLFSANDFGQGFPTETLTILTLSEAPSGAPTNVSGIPLGPKTALIKWEPPETSLQNGEILGYQAIASIQSIVLGSSSGDPNQRKNRTLLVDQKWDLQTELKNLLPNTHYKISVKAYNNAGIGPASSPLFLQTPEGAPDSPPIHLHCESLSPKSLQVQWEPPPFHLSNGQIQGYKVIYFPLHDEKMEEKGEVKKTSNRETTLHGLKSYTSYSIKALAYTQGGESNMSEPIICRTEEDVPEEPADIKASAISTSAALVSWLPPHHSNGVITKYTVFWKSEESGQVKEKDVANPLGPLLEQDEFFQEIRRLRESQKYSFWVKAFTSVGAGAKSRVETLELGSSISSIVPVTIASFSVVRSPELGQSLRLPCKAVGIPSPRIYWFKNNHPLSSPILSRNGSLFISGVKDRDEGVFTCRAENEHGSDEIEHRVIISRPPSSISIYLGYATYSSIQIHWDPPEKVQPLLTAYFLQYRKQMESVKNSQEWITVRLGPRLTSYSFENLLCGTQYLLRIYGENSVGKGIPSEIVKAKTNGNPPELPKLTEILDGNGTMIRIDLTRWSDGGCPITHFNIEYKKVHASNSATWLRVHKRDNSTRVFVIQTQLYSKYEIRIRVENDAGFVTKVFGVESDSDFFKNYANFLERVEKEVGINGSSVSLFTDPHVLVPIVSAIICTFAAAICVLMLIKRKKNQPQPEWKKTTLPNDTSQQTWLSTSVDGGTSKYVEAGESISSCPETMAIYTTINSTNPIPMTIRDSTVRFQSFGQQDNYEAPPGETTARFSKRRRRKSIASSPVEEMCLHQVSCQMEIEPSTEFRSSLRNIQKPEQLTFHQHSHLVSHKHNIYSGFHPHDNIEGIPTPRANSLPATEIIDDEDGQHHDYSCPYEFVKTATDNRFDGNNSLKNTLSSSSFSASGNKLRRIRDSSELF